MSQRLSYTVKEAAEATGLSPDTIKAAIHTTEPNRKLRAKPVSTHPDTGKVSKYLILHKDLESWLENLADV